MRRAWLALVAASLGWAQPAVNSRRFQLDELKTPPGFEVSVYATGVGQARLMTFGPNGVLYVAVRNIGVVAVPEQGRVVRVLTGLNGAHNLEFRDGALYVAVNDGVLRFANAVTEDLVIRGTGQRILSVPSGGGHSTRTLGFSPGGELFVTIGSTCNFCLETVESRAAMMRFDADGSNGRIHARGLRNSVDFDWHPVTGQLWALDHGGDGLGDDEPPEEINIIEGGADYGWPDCVGQRRGARWGAQARPERCGDTRGPEFEVQAHSAPLGLSFYTGDQFPASYRNDAFVGYHGSWNRNEPSGYKILRVRASSGRATGSEDFLWGFLDLRTRTRSGRPVHALNGPDGSMFVSDDATGSIYRVVYTGPRINPGGVVRVVDRIYELYGRNLTTDDGLVSVTANGHAAEVLYAGAGQINFILPAAVTGDVTLEVRNSKAADEAVISVE